MMDMEINPPRAIVVKQVVIQVPRVRAESECAERHGLERYSHTATREIWLIGAFARPTSRQAAEPGTFHRGFSKPGWQTHLCGRVTLDVAYCSKELRGVFAVTQKAQDPIKAMTQIGAPAVSGLVGEVWSNERSASESDAKKDRDVRRTEVKVLNPRPFKASEDRHRQSRGRGVFC